MGTSLVGVRIAIVGGGLIGSAWAALFAHFGGQVMLWDPSPEVRDSAPERVEAARVQLALAYPDASGAGRVMVADTLADAVDDVALVQENAPENVALKHQLYADIETHAAADTVIASSTSALTWSELSPGLTLPARFITAHPFNPPHLVPLVEIYGIDNDAVERAEAIYRAAARVPVRLRKDATGHIANRLSSALWREAVHIVADGIADVEQVDQALVNGPGLRWSVIGAHLAYHLGGGDGGLAGYLDHLGPSQERRWADLGSPRLDDATKAALIAGVERESAGRSIAELEVERDAALIAALRARSTSG